MGFVAELKRRNVFRVAIAYAVVAWLILQVGEVLAPALRLPEWINSALAFFLVLGFPLAILFAWAFEMTPEGLKFERDVDRTKSITDMTAKKVDRMIIVVLVAAVAFFAFDKFVLDPSRDAELVQAATEAAIAEQPVERSSIAVLPFADLSPEGDQEYFSDGIAEEILNVLVRVDELNVASRTSSFGFKGQEALGIPVIAEKLRVRHVLEGSVRKAGDAVRITAQLIDAQTDAHLWSETYDRTLTVESIFEIQDEIAQAIVRQLGVVLEEKTVRADTENLDAYELYLKAHKTFIERGDILAVGSAIDLFEQTVALDPSFARALAGLAAAYAVAPSWGVTDRDYLTLSTDTANRAIELDGSLAMGWAVLGYTAKLRKNYEEALRGYEKAVEINPKEPTAWLWRGILHNVLGYFNRAASDIDRCLDLDPFYANCLRHRARVALFSGDDEYAMELIERAMLLGFPAPNDMFLQMYAANGNTAVVAASVSTYMNNLGFEALVDYQYRALLDPGFDFDAEREEIEAIYQATTGDVLDWGPEDQLSPMVYGQYEHINPLSGLQAWWRPYPTGWRTSPHRKRLIREMGLPEHWRKHGFPPHCRAVGDDDFECDYPGRDKAQAEKTRRVAAPQ